MCPSVIEFRAYYQNLHIMSGKRAKSGSSAGRVAIVTDALVAFGGADRLLKTLLGVFPEAEIYTSMFDPEEYPWIDGKKVHTTFIQRLPFHSYWKRHYMGLSPIGFEQFSFDEQDTVISLSAGCAKGVITKDNVFHIGIVMDIAASIPFALQYRLSAAALRKSEGFPQSINRNTQLRGCCLKIHSS